MDTIRQISDAIMFFIIIITMLVRSTVGFVGAAIKYKVLGMEVPTGPEVYMSGRSEVPYYASEHKRNILVSSDKDVFDINDVTLTVGYGTFYIDEKEKYENGDVNASDFVLYVCNGKYSKNVYKESENYLAISNAYLMLHIPAEKSYDDEYAYDYDKGLFTYDLEYKCKTTVTVPKEVFSGKEGSVSFIFAGFSYCTGVEYYNGGEPFYSCSSNTYSVDMRYKVLDENTVDLQFENEWD